MSSVDTGGARPPPDAARRSIASGLVLLGGVASLAPGVPTAAALAGGAALALTVGNPLAARTRWLAKRLLPAAVVGLGGAMDLDQVLRAGLRGFAYTVLSIGATLLVGTLLARAFGVDRRTGALVTIGTAICGGSAIAAAAPVLGAEERELSVALATVFLLNSFALVLTLYLVGLGLSREGLREVGARPLLQGVTLWVATAAASLAAIGAGWIHP